MSPEDGVSWIEEVSPDELLVLPVGGGGYVTVAENAAERAEGLPLASPASQIPEEPEEGVREMPDNMMPRDWPWPR